MAETTTQVPVKPQTTTKPLSPIKLYQKHFCQNCPLQCNPDTTQFQNCILTLIADNLAQLRQTTQQRTQHLSW